MAALSDQLLVFTIIAYALAMLAYAAEYAFGTRGFVAASPLFAAQRELVGAGGPPVTVAGPEPAPVASSPLGALANPQVARWSAWGAIALTVLGWLLHVGCIVTRGLAAHRVPWGNMYEFVLAATLVGATTWLFVALRLPRLRSLGLWAALVLVALLGTDGMRLYTPVAPLVPALNSYWLKIHVTAAVISSGVLMLGFVAAALTLVRIGHDRGYTRFPFTLGDRLPGQDVLERLTFRVHVVAFPLWTFAIICGAIWAEAAWGRYWGWDPKETWSFIAWVIYAGYLHARATPSVKRWVSTAIACVGWGAMMVNLFAVNLVVTGLHSYAGIK